MKRIFFTIIAFLALVPSGFSQCPDPSITGMGFYPPADQLPCIERGLPYSEVIQINLPATFDTSLFGIAVTVTINTVTINNITGQPTGINYTCTPTNCQFPGGGAGCINLSGTTNDPAGTYNLAVSITANVTVPPILPLFPGGPQTLGPLDLGTLGITYSLRVIEQGAPCGPPPAVTISGTTSACAGGTTTLTADATNATNPTYSWSNGATTQAVTVGPGSYTVTVTADNGTATASATVGTLSTPSAAFTANVSGGSVSVTNTSTPSGTTTYSWNWGDGSADVTGQTPPAHSYSANGNYTITLTASNACGPNTATQQVNVTGVFITSIEYSLTFDVYPNPSNGNVFFNFSTDVSVDSYELKLFDLSGKNVWNERILNVGGTIQKQLDFSSMPKGVYTLQLNSENGFGVKKLVLH